MKDKRPEKQKLEEANLCPKCGREFYCSKSSKCWCYEIDISIDTMEQIQHEYDGCLCSFCLKEYSQSK
jgi:hypothetical protein